jgi:hypothetical protein
LDLEQKQKMNIKKVELKDCFSFYGH